TPPPFGYRIAARISVQPHMLMPFRSELEVERLLDIPTPPLSPVSLTSYTLPPLLMPFHVYSPLPTSSFPLPSSIPSTSGSESIPEADIPLWKRARFTTPTSRYEIGESSIAAATARQIRPTLTVAESRRANDGLIGRLRRERTLVTQMEALQRDKMAQKRRTTRLNPGTTPVTTPSTTTTSVTNAQLQAMINEGVNAALAVHDATRNGDDSHTSGTGARRLVQAAHECSYSEFLKCKPLDFKGTEGVVELTRWFEKIESVFSISNCTASNQTTTPEEAYAMTWATLKKKMTSKYCPRGEIKKIETEMWNLKASKSKTMQEVIKFTTELMEDKTRAYPERQTDNKRKSEDISKNNQNQQPYKRQNTGQVYTAGNGDKRLVLVCPGVGNDVVAYNRRFQQLALMCSRMFPEEIDKIEKYIGGLPDMILGSVKASRSKTMQEVIEFTTELMEDKTRAYAERQADNKRKPLCSKCNYNHEGPCPPKCNNCKRVGHLTKDCRSRPANNNNNNNRNNNNQQENSCFESGAQGHFKRNYPKLKNNDRGNQARNYRAPARVYAVGNAGANPDNVIAVP
nr:hypothetical protein [Tanacetum cinerariifolium]